MPEPTINDLYECRYEPDKLVILIERMHKNSLKAAVLAQQTNNIAITPCPHHGNIEVIPGNRADVCLHPKCSEWSQA